MNKYAIFTAATGPIVGRNYLSDVNSLLNSIQKHRLHERINGTLDVYLIHYGFDPAWNYLNKAQGLFDFNLIPVDIEKFDIPCPNGTKAIEFIKRARYSIILTYGPRYEAICLLDADMFFVSDEFVSMFELVAGTRKLIGANERIKWDVGPKQYFESDGVPIFDKPDKMRSMICNVPSVFDMKEWMDVFEYYRKICFNGFQITDGVRKGIGDLFAHNIAIKRMNRESDVVMFPMETMAQVHHVWRKPWTHLINDNGKWRTFSGDKVYLIHDTKRICQGNFVEANIEAYRNEFAGWKDVAAFEPKIRSGLQAVQNEWYDLNIGKDARLKIYDFLPNNDEWNHLKK
jgi:hypothetical protein